MCHVRELLKRVSHSACIGQMTNLSVNDKSLKDCTWYENLKLQVHIGPIADDMPF